VDHEHREGFVAVLAAPGPRDGEIVGHLCLEPADNAATAEVAVADAFRGRGIGRALVQRAIDWAVARGLRELRATTFVSNVRILALLRSVPFRARVPEADGDIVELSIPLRPGIIARAA
jgi:GNAT superfamily N-acetyltransferase